MGHPFEGFMALTGNDVNFGRPMAQQRPTARLSETSVARRGAAQVLRA